MRKAGRWWSGSGHVPRSTPLVDQAPRIYLAVQVNWASGGAAPERARVVCLSTGCGVLAVIVRIARGQIAERVNASDWLDGLADGV